MQTSFQYKNGNVSYRKEGSGQTVVLLHGFGEDSTIWDKQLPFLKAFCQVIVPDLPGSGQSTLLQPAKSETPVTIEDYADCIFALLQQEQVASCIMLGHSMGGYITLAFAGKYSQVLNGFGLVHSTAFADSEEKKAARRKGIELMRQYGGFSFLKNTIPNLFADEYKQKNAESVALLIEKGKEFSTDALIQYYTAMIYRDDRTAVLKNSIVPVLFIIGSQDVAAPLNDLLQQVHLPGVSYIHILEGVGHMGMWEATDEINKHLAAFIRDINEP